jgi:hypothetical protein
MISFCSPSGRSVYDNLPEQLKSDRDIVLAAARIDGGNMVWSIPTALKGDKDIYKAIIVEREEYCLYEYIPSDMQAVPEIARYAVMKEGRNLKYAPADLRDDFDLVLTAVKESDCLSFVSDRLKDDSNVVLAAVTNQGLALQYASERLRDDETIVIPAIAANGQAFQYASDRLRGEKKIALEAFKTAGDQLQYASEELRDDFDVVLQACKQCPDALQYASDRLKDDEFFLTSAAPALLYCSERLKGHKPLVLACVQKAGSNLQYASEALRNDLEVVAAAMDNDIFAFQYASEELRNHYDLRSRVGEAARKAADDGNGYSFFYSGGEAFKDVKEVALACLGAVYNLYYEVSDGLKEDRDIVIASINAGNNVLGINDSAMLRSDKELALLSIDKISGFDVSCLSEALRADYDVCLAAVKKNYTNAYYLDPATMSRRDILIERAKGGAPLGEIPGPFDDDDEIVAACVTANYTVSKHASSSSSSFTLLDGSRRAECVVSHFWFFVFGGEC